MSSFMQPEVTDKQTWITIDGTCGMMSLPIDALAQNRAEFLLLDEEAQLETLRAYYEGEPQSFEIVKGFGARLSAPGYLDCTDWCVFDTEDEAKQYLTETYSEDEDEDENEDEDGPVCNACCAAMINGRFCHETGCPNERKTWVPGRGWVKFVACFECGCDVELGEVCSCQEPEGAPPALPN